jgi:hypothetical protein
MDAKEIRELFDLQQVLADVSGSVDADIVTEPNVLAALLEWKHADDGKIDVKPESPKPKRSKAKTAEPEKDSFEATPDPSADDEPDF